MNTEHLDTTNKRLNIDYSYNKSSEKLMFEILSQNQYKSKCISAHSVQILVTRYFTAANEIRII